MISIHAPREGSDEIPPETHYLVEEFQSTLPVRGATTAVDSARLQGMISIHAPREGSDGTYEAIGPHFQDFNPRSP